jgi:hypothetical protein
MSTAFYQRDQATLNEGVVENKSVNRQGKWDRLKS